MTEFIDLKVKEQEARLVRQTEKLNHLETKITLIEKRLTHHLEQFEAHGGRKE